MINPSHHIHNRKHTKKKTGTVQDTIQEGIKFGSQILVASATNKGSRLIMQICLNLIMNHS